MVGAAFLGAGFRLISPSLPLVFVGTRAVSGDGGRCRTSHPNAWQAGRGSRAVEVSGGARGQPEDRRRARGGARRDRAAGIFCLQCMSHGEKVCHILCIRSVLLTALSVPSVRNTRKIETSSSLLCDRRRTSTAARWSRKRSSSGPTTRRPSRRCVRADGGLKNWDTILEPDFYECLILAVTPVPGHPPGIDPRFLW